MKIGVILTLFFLIVNRVCAQDTALIYFKNIKIPFDKHAREMKLNSTDSRTHEIIVSIDRNKYFYLRSSLEDGSIFESGLLGLYMVEGQCFLLREGPWLLNRGDKIILFDNLRNGPIAEEIETSLEAPDSKFFSGQTKKKSKRQRVAGSAYR